MKNSNDTIGNRTRDLPTCNAVPQPTAPLRSSLPYQVGNTVHLLKIFLNFLKYHHSATFRYRMATSHRTLLRLMKIRVTYEPGNILTNQTTTSFSKLALHNKFRNVNPNTKKLT